MMHLTGEIEDETSVESDKNPAAVAMGHKADKPTVVITTVGGAIPEFKAPKID